MIQHFRQPSSRYYSSASFSFHISAVYSCVWRSTGAPHLEEFSPGHKDHNEAGEGARDLHVRVVWAITHEKKKEVRKRPANIFSGGPPVFMSFSFFYFRLLFCFPFARSSGNKKRKKGHRGIYVHGRNTRERKKKGSPPRITRLDNVSQYIRKAPPHVTKGRMTPVRVSPPPQ
jgi:hypothetical protein